MNKFFAGLCAVIFALVAGVSARTADWKGFYMGGKSSSIEVKDYANAFFEIGDYEFNAPAHHGTGGNAARTPCFCDVRSYRGLRRRFRRHRRILGRRRLCICLRSLFDRVGSALLTSGRLVLGTQFRLDVSSLLRFCLSFLVQFLAALLCRLHSGYS